MSEDAARAGEIATLTGRCLCGASAFEADFKIRRDGSLKFGACHCDMCRRWTGGPLMAMIAEGALRFQDESAVAVYQGSDWAERGFCKTCGSSLFWRLKSGANVVVPIGLLDDQSQLVFASEIFIDCKPDFYAFAGERKTMTEAEMIAASVPNP